MKNLLRFLAFNLMVGSVYAQSNLPACQGSYTAWWTNCVGSDANSVGHKYVGEFKDGKYNGQGTYTTRFDSYVGEFKDGKYNGQGTFTFHDGNKYVGEYKNDRRNVQGIFTFTNGNKYIGNFKDNQFNGQGTYTFPNGNKYVGDWKDGKRNGQGTFTNAGGEQFVGEWKDDMLNGQGTRYASNGSIINQGIWERGIFFGFVPVQQASTVNQTVPLERVQPNAALSNLQACPQPGFGHNCWGTVTDANGRKYVGEFQYYQRNGQGIEYSQDGSVLRSGTFSTLLGGRSNSVNLISNHPIETSRFPFNTQNQTFVINNQSAPVQQASTGNQTVPAVAVQLDNSERDRLAAEVQAERKKRQELEEQLRVAQQSNKQRVPSGIERRVALVIGNSTYRVSPLDNPANDATDITNALNKVGFRTTLIRNATLGQMRDATRKFAEQLQSADVALIYFAGHGIESNRKNYMIPVNADLKFEYELTDQAYDAGSWLEMLETIKSSNSERVNIVILDACRNNNLIGSRSLGSGLGRMDAPTGTFLSYSTAPGKVAADGSKGQRNSPFTRHLLNVIQQPGLQIEEAFKEVRRNVSRDTNGAQVPWESTSLVGKFYFTVQR